MLTIAYSRQSARGPVPRFRSAQKALSSGKEVEGSRSSLAYRCVAITNLERSVDDHYFSESMITSSTSGQIVHESAVDLTELIRLGPGPQYDPIQGADFDIWPGWYSPGGSAKPLKVALKRSKTYRSQNRRGSQGVRNQ